MKRLNKYKIDGYRSNIDLINNFKINREDDIYEKN